jgi:hypothetical protein
MQIQPYLQSKYNLSIHVRTSYLDFRPMERIPNTPHTLINTGHRLARLPVLLACAISQYLCLFPHAFVLEVFDTYRPLGAVDVLCDYDRVPPWPRADGNLDLWVVLRKRGE